MQSGGSAVPGYPAGSAGLGERGEVIEVLRVERWFGYQFIIMVSTGYLSWSCASEHLLDIYIYVILYTLYKAERSAGLACPLALLVQLRSEGYPRG